MTNGHSSPDLTEEARVFLAVASTYDDDDPEVPDALRHACELIERLVAEVERLRALPGP